MYDLVISILLLIDLYSCGDSQNNDQNNITASSYTKLPDHQNSYPMTTPSTSADKLTDNTFDFSDLLKELPQPFKIPNTEELDDMINQANWRLFLRDLKNNKDNSVINPNIDILIRMRSVIGNVGYIIHYYLYIHIKISDSDRETVMSYFETLPSLVRMIIFPDESAQSNELVNFKREESIILLKDLMDNRPDIYIPLFKSSHPPFLCTEVLTIFEPVDSANMVYQFCKFLLEICDCYKLYDTVYNLLTFVKINQQFSSDTNKYILEVELIIYALASRYMEIRNFVTSPEYFCENRRSLMCFPSISKVLNDVEKVPPHSHCKTIDSTTQKQCRCKRRYKPYY